MPEPLGRNGGNVQTPKPDLAHAGICVAGYGHWGKNLTRNFSALGHLYAVCESSVGHRDACTQQYPGLRTYSEFAEALADPGVAAVALATPAEQHCRMALEALAAGKDVFVEKPLALEAREGWEMVEAARRAQRILMVGHLLRYHPAIIKIQELLAQGILGRIDYIYSNRLSMGKIRQEENAL